MELIVVRHAIALERDLAHQKGIPDSERPLTNEGTIKFEKMAKALQKIEVGVELIVSSKLLRAQQTAKILLKNFPKSESLESHNLSPEKSPQDIVGELETLHHKKIAIVGHEPNLSALTAWLVTKQLTPFVKFKKGGILKLKFPEKVKEGTGVLTWYLTPGTLLKI